MLSNVEIQGSFTLIQINHVISTVNLIDLIIHTSLKNWVNSIQGFYFGRKSASASKSFQIIKLFPWIQTHLTELLKLIQLGDLIKINPNLWIKASHNLLLFFEKK